jgi:anaerobic selenocysteine-containing dehydrogenase
MQQETTNTKIVRTVCQECHVGCGVLVSVRDGQAVKIEGDPEHPLNQGMMCPKGLSEIQLVYHPDRLKYPMKRAGDRGEGKWQRISWDEALDTTAARLTAIRNKYGPLAIAGSGGGKPTKPLRSLFLFINALGSPNVGWTDSHYCFGPFIIAEVFTYGGIISQEHQSDCRNSNCIVVWGANPVNSHPTWARMLIQAKARGAKLITVDPRFTLPASKADVWLQLRPGTDAALALGMLNVIINEELYDREFVNRWCLGFEELRERVQEYPPDEVAAITSLSRDDIIKAAMLYATTKPATIYSRAALEMQANATQTLRAISILRAVTGNIDVKGGNIFNCPVPGLLAYNYPLGSKDHRPPDELEARRLGAAEFPLLSGPRSPFVSTHSPTLIKALLTDKPYPIKAWFIINNVLLCLPNSRQVYEALKRPDLVVVSELFMTPTAQMADIVLPAATWLETDEVVSCYRNLAVCRQKAIEPVGECRDELGVYLEILKRMGEKFTFAPVETTEQELDYRLSKTGLTFQDLKAKHIVTSEMEYKKYLKTGFRTPSGKVELYSSVFKEFGYDPLPAHVEPPESLIATPELAKEYPLVLIAGRRVIGYMHSMGRQIPWLRDLVPDPLVEMHPATAEKLGIKEGDWVWIELPNSKGRIKNRAKLTKGIQPTVVQCDAHWWFPEKPASDYGHWEVNINALIDGSGRGDTIAGTEPLVGLLCKVYK